MSPYHFKSWDNMVKNCTATLFFIKMIHVKLLYENFEYIFKCWLKYLFDFNYFLSAFEALAGPTLPITLALS